MSIRVMLVRPTAPEPSATPPRSETTERTAHSWAFKVAEGDTPWVGREDQRKDQGDSLYQLFGSRRVVML